MNTELFKLYRHMKEGNIVFKDDITVSYNGEVVSAYNTFSEEWDAHNSHEELSISYNGTPYITIVYSFGEWTVKTGFMGSEKKTIKSLSCPMYLNNRYLFFNTEKHDSTVLSGELVEIVPPEDLVNE